MIFVTGGTGLIGSHLLYELVSTGKNVKALKRETSNPGQVLKTFSYYTENPEDLFHKIEWIDGDILDYFGIEELLGDVDEIYHCAATVSFQKNDRKSMIVNNVEGTANIIDAALEKKVKKFCHVSSVSALGRLQNEHPVTEETNWVPSKKISGYSESKFFSEAEVWRGIEEGLNAVILNPSIVLGPGNWENGSAKLFKTIWNRMKFYTRGITGFVDVRDVVKAMVLLMDDANFENFKNQRFILNSENLSYHQLFNQMADELDKPRPKIYTSDFMLKVAWRAAALYGRTTGKPTAITRDAVSGSNHKNFFDGSKITRSIDFSYRPISESIRQTANLLKKDMAKSNP